MGALLWVGVSTCRKREDDLKTSPSPCKETTGALSVLSSSPSSLLGVEDCATERSPKTKDNVLLSGTCFKINVNNGGHTNDGHGPLHKGCSGVGACKCCWPTPDDSPDRPSGWSNFCTALHSASLSACQHARLRVPSLSGFECETGWNDCGETSLNGRACGQSMLRRGNAASKKKLHKLNVFCKRKVPLSCNVHCLASTQ